MRLEKRLIWRDERRGGGREEECERRVGEGEMREGEVGGRRSVKGGSVRER